MKKEVSKIIKEIYFDKNYELYRDKLKNQIDYLSEFQEILEKQDVKIEHYTHLDSPEDEWWLEYTPFENNGNPIKYETVVRLSRIFPVFNISHEFQLKHINPRKMAPRLYGFDAQPYTFEQADIDKLVTDYFNEKGFIKLWNSELEEVIPNLPMPEGITIFGPQMTVDTALFRDVYNISEEN